MTPGFKPFTKQAKLTDYKVRSLRTYWSPRRRRATLSEETGTCAALKLNSSGRWYELNWREHFIRNKGVLYSSPPEKKIYAASPPGVSNFHVLLSWRSRDGQFIFRPILARIYNILPSRTNQSKPTELKMVFWPFNDVQFSLFRPIYFKCGEPHFVNVKINRPVKTPWRRPSVRVANSMLWAPGMCLFTSATSPSD